MRVFKTVAFVATFMTNSARGKIKVSRKGLLSKLLMTECLQSTAKRNLRGERLRIQKH